MDEMCTITEPHQFKVSFKINKKLDEYGVTVPAHVKAIRQSLTPPQNLTIGSSVDIVYTVEKGPLLLCDFNPALNSFDYFKYKEIIQSPYRKLFDMMDGEVIDVNSVQKKKSNARDVKKARQSIDSFFGY
jgi:hypothetical protein